MVAYRMRIGYPTPGSVVMTAAQGSYAVNGQSTALTYTPATGGTITFPLTSGHSYTQRMSMQAIFPRPDSDGDINSWERQKLHPSGIALRLPICIQGGVRPFHFALLTAPSGAIVGQDLYTNWGTNRFQNYGMIQWANPTIGTHTFQYQVTDQTGSTLTVSFDMVVRDREDTNYFLWVDAAAAGGGNGSYSTPYQTLNSPLGSSSSATTIQGHCIVKEGTYNVPIHGNFLCELDNTKRPVVVYAMPTDVNTPAAVTFNGTAGFHAQGHYTGLFFGDVTMNGGLNVGVGSWRWFTVGDGGQKRNTYFNINFSNVALGSAGTDNATSIFYATGATSDPASYDQYVAVSRVTESGRVKAMNSYGVFSWYGVKNAVVEDVYFTGGSAYVCYLKDSCQQVTVAMSDAISDDGPTFASGCQNQNGGTFGNVEWIYNRERRGVSDNNTRVWNDVSTAASGSHWSARNTIQGFFEINAPSASGGGPYVLENDIVQTSVSPPVVTGTRVTNTGTQLQGNGSYTDSNFLLIGSFRTTYIGIRGWEIAN